ncbi:ochratoxin A non-ribosomal peptide synthetase, variant [Blastomyces dermatitidis ER-3]|uniref:Ochratoxin A non-ribosomal peptide synthetase n=1 Tax=Ajellomyces dermatitidis (strain ER-3 / ATCC MYA-2586) TaxID=559297 RepID=A0ABX2VVZ8_AJEDR|nr:ochratoxin A non-ribosomal peptide synthetase [Blastomyces dermatitidis ER-3]XP_045281061.1 ochratoxin A non-ribosomal peptide synthetase, variant [Blastomyces dermatitidis ER-3]OAT01333.1 ochratoxin A non-ribosomal peptide synthetase [Blastomyces dermatitidis ER-3]OAT01334.1 ochratoxin A non-ribosomal peptide synthetase, variant [Blastomyces dermatitidis ER-3]
MNQAPPHERSPGETISSKPLFDFLLRFKLSGRDIEICTYLLRATSKMGSVKVETRTLSSDVDLLKDNNPNQLFCIHPVSPDISQGWRRITMKDLSFATDLLAHWIEANVAARSNHETLAYMGANDIRYAAFILACSKVGHVPLLISPRNSVEASRHLLEETGCSKFVYSVERERQVNELRSADPSIQVWTVPDLWDVFTNSEVVPYEAVGKQHRGPEDEVAAIIHSSGTTGMPKPVPLTHGYIAAQKRIQALPVPPGRVASVYSACEQGKLAFVMSPFFHFMGLLTLITSITGGTPFALSPEKPLTAELLDAVVTETGATSTSLPPSAIEDLYASQLGRETLAKFHYIAYGGAPLSPDTGDKLCKLTHVQTVLGSSECGLIAALKAEDREDWGYFEWNPFYAVDMRAQGDGTFELVIPRQENRYVHGVFHTYPDLQEYRTGDLFIPHTQKPGLWRYIGRGDDVIVLSNGEKFNPTSMELVIQGHPLVSKAMVMGQGRFQAALLCELDWDNWTGDEIAFIEEIWPTVQRANEGAPGHGRLMKSKIGISSPSKPFKTTPKGSVQRRMVIADYSNEIETLYSKSDNEAIITISKDATAKEVAVQVRAVVSSLLPSQEIGDNSDIFSLGIDSLQSLQLGQALDSAVRAICPQLRKDAFSSRQIYSHPSVFALSQYMYDLIHGTAMVDEAGTGVEDDNARSARLRALVEKYTTDLVEKHSVILTGSTGSLGCYLLHELLLDPAVAKVYCLNRSEDAAGRQIKSFQEKGLSTFKAFASRVEFLHAKFGDERLGLATDAYDRVLESVDTIIHNAWKVNFNHQVEAFEQPHIEGVRRLVDFSIASTHRAHIHFISSISTIEGWDTTKRGMLVPEEIYEDADVVMRTGYGESKHVGERICAFASSYCGVPTTIHRVGQIGGPTTEKGVWNKQEWFPSLVATSKTIKQLPLSLGTIAVDWIPVDTISRVILDILRSRRKTEEEVRCAAFHLVNPSPAPWDSLIPAIKKHFPVEIVDPQKWIASLEAIANPTQADLQDKPALKILDFFRGAFIGQVEGSGKPPVLDTQRTQEASVTMQRLKPIDQDILNTWMLQWQF